MIPLDLRARGNRADPYAEPNSCFSDSSDSLNSLNSLNSMKVPLHLEKTPLYLKVSHERVESCEVSVFNWISGFTVLELEKNTPLIHGVALWLT